MYFDNLSVLAGGVPAGTADTAQEVQATAVPPFMASVKAVSVVTVAAETVAARRGKENLIV